MGARYFNPYRLAAYVLVVYALGHTLGAVAQTPRFGGDGDAVGSSMKAVHLQAQGADCTWYGFYEGFAIIVSIFFALSVVIAWHLGGATLRERRSLAVVAWGLFASYVGCAVVTWAYFFPAPIAFASVTAALLGFACIRDAVQSTSDRPAVENHIAA